MRMKLALVDVDGVLLNYERAFAKFHSIPASLIWNNGKFNAEGDIDAMCEEFNQSPDFAEIDPIPAAEAAVQRLRDNGYTLIAITACGKSLPTMHYRLRNLDDVFGAEAFHDVIFRDIGGSKAADMEALHDKGAIFIDDTYRHVLDAHRHGYRTLYMDTPFNANYAEVPHVQARTLDIGLHKLGVPA